MKSLARCDVIIQSVFSGCHFSAAPEQLVSNWVPPPHLLAAHYLLWFTQWGVIWSNKVTFLFTDLWIKCSYLPLWLECCFTVCSGLIHLVWLHYQGVCVCVCRCMWIYSTVVCEKAAFFTYKSVLCQPLLNGQPLGSLLPDKHIFQGNKVCRWGNNKYSVKYRLWRDNLFTEKMRVGTEKRSICFHLLWIGVCTWCMIVHIKEFRTQKWKCEFYLCLSVIRPSIHLSVCLALKPPNFT